MIKLANWFLLSNEKQMKTMSLIKSSMVLFFLLFVSVVSIHAQNLEVPKEVMVKGSVKSVSDEGYMDTNDTGGINNYYQKVTVELLDGEDAGKIIEIEHGGKLSISESQKVKVGQKVVLLKSELKSGEAWYQIIDKYRLNELVYIGAFFLILVIALSRWKGVGSFFGMLLSLGVIVKYIVPEILAGKDPLTVSVIGAIVILVASIYLAHGFSKQTTVAVISTSLTLLLTGFLAVLFVNLTQLTGVSSEESFSLQFGSTSAINFKGLLLGGMIIGFLGVLDDITTGLAATVFELKKINKKLKMNELVSSSLNIGREHISSLVNTLVLAYAGVSLPLFLFVVLNPQGYPLWFVLNSEFIAEEIVRTLTGSIGLLLAVPITAIISAWVVTREVN